MSTNIVITKVGVSKQHPPVGVAKGSNVFQTVTYTASGTAQNTSAVPVSSGYDYAAIIVTEEKIWVKIGVSAVAASEEDFLMLAGDRLELGIAAGERVSIISA